MINWTLNGKQYESSCGKYRIDNAGSKGGDHYRVLTLHEYSNTWCSQLSQGTLKEMMQFGEKNEIQDS